MAQTRVPSIGTDLGQILRGSVCTTAADRRAMLLANTHNSPVKMSRVNQATPPVIGTIRTSVFASGTAKITKAIASAA